MVRFRKFAAPDRSAMQEFKKGMRDASLSFVSDIDDTEISVLVAPFSSEVITEVAQACGLEEVPCART